MRPPCFCRGYDPADPCMHGDTSEGCPRHDPIARADWDADNLPPTPDKETR